jgi:hypothetical protein
MRFGHSSSVMLATSSSRCVAPSLLSGRMHTAWVSPARLTKMPSLLHGIGPTTKEGRLSGIKLCVSHQVSRFLSSGFRGAGSCVCTHTTHHFMMLCAPG